MKTTLLIGSACFAGFVATIAAPTWGQPQRKETAEQEQPDVQEQDKEDGFARLPAPLDGISGNLLDLERSGHLRIIRGVYGRTKLFDDRAMIWTIEVVKPLTCGHAILLLHDVSDVRFYRDDEDYHREVFSTRLFYESWLDVGTVSHEILDRDERFDIWIDLTEAEAWKLNHENANRVIFGRPRKRHGIDSSLWRWK